jgi:hypothetical protein
MSDGCFEDRNGPLWGAGRVKAPQRVAPSTETRRENPWDSIVAGARQKYQALRDLSDRTGAADSIGGLLSYIAILERDSAPSAQTRDDLKLKTLLVRALVELGYVESSTSEAVGRGILDSSNRSMFASDEGREIIEKGMKLLGLKDLSEEEIARVHSPAATNCCTATEVEAARKDKEIRDKLREIRNPERTLEERAQEAAEAIDAQYEFYISFIDDPRDKVIAKVKAIILSCIGGAE